MASQKTKDFHRSGLQRNVKKCMTGKKYSDRLRTVPQWQVFQAWAWRSNCGTPLKTNSWEKCCPKRERAYLIRRGIDTEMDIENLKLIGQRFDPVAVWFQARKWRWDTQEEKDDLIIPRFPTSAALFDIQPWKEHWRECMKEGKTTHQIMPKLTLLLLRYCTKLVTPPIPFPLHLKRNA